MSDVTVTITKEELRRTISALQLMFAARQQDAESREPSEDPANLMADAEVTRALIKKIRTTTTEPFRAKGVDK